MSAAVTLGLAKQRFAGRIPTQRDWASIIIIENPTDKIAVRAKIPAKSDFSALFTEKIAISSV